MNSKYLIISMIIMAGVTYLPRVLPLALIRTKIKNRFICSFLTYMPYGVLSAMIFPAIFKSTSTPVSAISGTAVAFLLAYKNKGLMTVALSAVVTVLITEWLLGLNLFC